MARIKANQDFSCEMLMVSALLMEQINNAIVTTSKMLSEIDSIGLSTCDLGETTFMVSKSRHHFKNSHAVIYLTPLGR